MSSVARNQFDAQLAELERDEKWRKFMEIFGATISKNSAARPFYAKKNDKKKLKYELTI